MNAVGEASLDQRAAEGARNLLQNCAGVAAGERVLVVREEPRIAYFDQEVPRIVEDEARALGAEVYSLTTARAEGPDHIPEILAAAIERVDHTIFLSRIGDQMRFKALPGAGSKTMVFALDVEILGSRFARLHHGLLTEVLRRLQREIDARPRWRITCPLGTDVSGTTPDREPDAAAEDFLLHLFPVTTFRPISCAAMSGRIVLARWVNSTNTHLYQPEVLRLDQTVTAIVEDGQLVDLEGDADTVARLWRHAETVAGRLGIDARRVHSWHAGINPGASYRGRAGDDPVRWAGMIFGSPRYLHFHTCGDYAPGEISWHVLDPTVTFDDEAYWRSGHLRLLARPEIRELLQSYHGAEESFEVAQDIGL